MIVITVGKSYIDIDGYASSIAYRELLKIKGIESKFVSDAILNYSITDSLKNIPYTTDNYDVVSDDKFIILDLSDKSYFPSFVNEDNIIEIIDHHPGYEDYWNNILGNKAIIKPIGSVATIIVEKYEQEGLLDKMNKDVAKLLMAAILDNTVDRTQYLEYVEGTNKDNEKVVNYVYKLTNLSAAHNLVITCTASAAGPSIFLKINGSWVTCSKVYQKVSGSWVEVSNPSTLFSTSANYVQG